MTVRAAVFRGLGSAALLLAAWVAPGATAALQAATPQPATIRLDIPADFAPAVPAPIELGGTPEGGVSFTTRLGGVLSSFSLDRAAGSPGDAGPRMMWSRPIGSSVIGARLGHGGWSVNLSGGYGGEATGGPGGTFGQPSAATQRTGWSTGLDYESGPWQFGGYYQFSRSELGATGPGTHLEQSGYGVGANYTLAPGMRLFSEAFFYNDVASGSRANGNAPTSGTIKPQSGQLYVIGTHLEW